MKYNRENIKVLVQVLRNKNESTLYLKDQALRIYYQNISKVPGSDNDSLQRIMPYPLFKILSQKYIYNKIGT